MIDDFVRAACAGEMDTLVQYPELVNVRHEKATALHFAAIAGQMDVARWLVEHGADLDAVDDDYLATPLRWANESGQQAMVDYLLSRGANVTVFDAAALGLIEQLEMTDEEKEWGTLLHTACIWGQPAVVDWLLERGADPTHASQQGLTALEIAEHQALNGRTHTPIVNDERCAELERDCAAIVARLRM